MDMPISLSLNTEALSGCLTIDLTALAENYRTLCRLAEPAETSAVVKADAYGLSATKVAPVLYAAGCRKFFVAHLKEAAALKPALPDDAQIFILNGLMPGGETYASAQGFIPVLNSLEQVANWQRTATMLGKRLPALLQFDTGMSRLGLSPDEAARLAAHPELMQDIDCLYIMSHLASADERESVQNADQLADMQKYRQLFPGIPLCFANSGGIFMGQSFTGDLVRPGIALYGGVPSDLAEGAIRPVVRLAVRVIQTRTVPAGTKVGYGATHVTTRETRLATLAAGYADGLPRALSDRGAAWFNGVRLPIVGRVSMDSMTVDISALPEGALPLGTLVDIIGPQQSLEEVAAQAGTISYEILTSLGQRYHRIYL
ncbi:alanine racemase [Allorhizobium sp. BGMRC 0089]|uniref:alanine racemase n=1 Tax=Allorhizobium sonneratiae TaxID=2934936 RepID=UPI00203402CD|nr:alanine racemase [Allorhizobium sonneratiae]MCM2293273.1 alanine racemase [Allorhizobium sonneratiae]